MKRLLILPFCFLITGCSSLGSQKELQLHDEILKPHRCHEVSGVYSNLAHASKLGIDTKIYLFDSLVIQNQRQLLDGTSYSSGIFRCDDCEVELSWIASKMPRLEIALISSSKAIKTIILSELAGNLDCVNGFVIVDNITILGWLFVYDLLETRRFYKTNSGDIAMELEAVNNGTFLNLGRDYVSWSKLR